jgi:outer membrane protein assembly factor BamB
LPAGFPQNDVWRFDTVTGEPLWETAKGAIADLVYSSAAVAGHRLVVGMNHGRYQSLDLETGAVGWKFDPGGAVYLSSPLVVEDRIYMFPGDAAGRLFAINAADGAPIAGFPVTIPDTTPVVGGQRLGQGPSVSSPMTAAGLIIVQLRREDTLAQPSGVAKVVMREFVVAIDPSSATVRWQRALGTKMVENANGVPELSTCPTPAGFAGETGAFVVVSSSVLPRVAVLDALTGEERWGATLSAPGRSSPIFSNGRLFVATDAGVVHAFSSDSNRAPTPPTRLGPSGEQTSAAQATVIDWDGATDPEGGVLSYQVRLEQDGHPQTMIQTQTDPGQTNLKGLLDASTAYRFTVRSRDPRGALSAWSAPQQFRTAPAAAAVPVGTETVPPDQVEPTPTVPVPAPAVAVDMRAVPASPTVTPPTNGSTGGGSIGKGSHADDGASAGGCSLGANGRTRGHGSAAWSVLGLALAALAVRGRARRV